MSLSAKASSPRHLAPAAGGAAAILLGLACAPSPPADVLATWRDGRALVTDLESFVQGLPEDQRRPAPGRSLEDWVGQWLRQLAVRDLMTRRAREADDEDDPRLDLRARYLASMDVGRRFVRERCPDEPIDEAEVQRVHARRVARGAQPWILVRHIFRRVSPEAAGRDRPRLRAEMIAVLEELRGGAGFVEMARRHSDSETAEQGGLIGRISRQAPMDPAFVTAAWKLADGEMSDVLDLSSGFHIVLREDSGIDEPSSYEASAAGIRRELRRARQEACGRRLLNEAAASMVVRFPESGLPVQPRPDEPILWVGEEIFTTRELDALVGEGAGLAGSHGALQTLQQFAEALLLASSARGQSAELDAAYREREGALREGLALEAAWRKARRDFVAQRPEDELRDYFEQHREQFRSELELDLAMILLRVSETRGVPATIQLAESLAQRARAGEPFEELAQEHSEHATATDGGRLGPLPWTRASVLFGPESVKAAAALAPGEVAGPLLIARRPVMAYAVLRLYGRREPESRSFDQARDEVIDALVSRRVGELDRALREQMLAQADFEINDDGLAAYVQSLRAPAPS